MNRPNLLFTLDERFKNVNLNIYNHASVLVEIQVSSTIVFILSIISFQTPIPNTLKSSSKHNASCRKKDHIESDALIINIFVPLLTQHKSVVLL